MNTVRRPTWIEIDLNQIKRNFISLRKFLKRNVRIIAVVKADAYGHGAVPVAKCLEKIGADVLAVAILEEALELRSAGIKSPILILNGFWPGQEKEIIREKLTPAIFRKDMIKTLRQEGERLGIPVGYYLKIDTGMTRLGFAHSRVNQIFTECFNSRWANCEGFYTHLSSAEDKNDPVNQVQIKRFKQVLETFPFRKNFLLCNHLANSAAILNFPDALFDAVRPGLLLYGINPLDSPSNLETHSALSFKTSIIQIKKVDAGSRIGYGGTFRTKRNSEIATLPVGFADGLNRLLSNKGSVILHGQKLSIVGRISMDLTTIEIPEHTTARIGDEVCLIGSQGDEQISIKEVADHCNTLPYEVLCGFGSRVQRIYSKNI